VDRFENGYDMSEDFLCVDTKGANKTLRFGVDWSKKQYDLLFWNLIIYLGNKLIQTASGL
jgi:hypothetical protein